MSKFANRGSCCGFAAIKAGTIGSIPQVNKNDADNQLQGNSNSLAKVTFQYLNLQFIRGI